MSSRGELSIADTLSQFFTMLAGLTWVLPLALVLSLVLPVAVKPLLAKLGVTDVPNERSSHSRPVLRGLGLAVLIAMGLAGGVGGWILATGSAIAPWQLWTFSVVVAGGLLAGLLGLSEDLHGLSVRVRSALLLLLAISVAGVLLWVLTSLRGGVALMLNAQLGLSDLGIVWLVLLGVYAVLFVSSYINVANFMDGLNGISGFHGAIAGIGFLLAGFFAQQAWLVFAGAILAGGFIGFLPWNLSKPGAFLGDVGSYLLGGAVAMTSFAALLAGVPVLATIGPMVIYFGDVAVTLVRRVKRGDRWDEPHKEHAYQRLHQLGLSHEAASGITALFTLAATALGLASFFTELWGTLALLVLGVGLVALYTRLPAMLGARRSSAA